MKSRTSFFNLTALRKDITRFWPAWVLYLVMQLLVISGGSVFSAPNVVSYMTIMSPINCAYALLCAQVLFGDLYNTRLCNALHAFPMRREGWFCTHVLAGLWFAFVPNLIAGALMGLGCWKLWYVGLIWTGVSMLQFVVFFGIAVFSALCVGSRFAQAVLYALLNFFSMLVFWLIDTLYKPMLYGVVIDWEPFTLFSPVWKLTSLEYVELERVYDDMKFDSWYEFAGFSGESWMWLGIYVAVGVVLLVAALQLYRRRALESAGEFLALRPLEPLFQVVYTLSMGALVALFGELFSSGMYVFLAVGIVVGFFTGEILIKRTVRVFNRKSLLRFAALSIVFVLSLFLTSLDPMGVARWVPDGKDVASVVFEETSTYHYEDWPALTDPEEIQKVIDIHSQILKDKDTPVSNSDDATVNLTYRLKNGTKVERRYTIRVKTQAGELLRDYLTTPEMVLGEQIKDLDYYLSMIEKMNVNGFKNTAIDKEENRRGLLEAIIADCKAGTMVQSWNYHRGDSTVAYVSMELSWEDERDSGSYRTLRNMYLEVRVYENCENTLKWMKDHGIELEDPYK